MTRVARKTEDLAQWLEKAQDYDDQARKLLLEGERFGEAEQAQYHRLVQQCAMVAMWTLRIAIDELRGRDAEAGCEQ